MPRPCAVSALVNAPCGGLGDASWLRDPRAGLGRVGRAAAGILARAIHSALSGAPYVESASLGSQRIGVRRATFIAARSNLVARGLLAPTGLTLEEGRARACEAGAVNGQVAYLVDMRRIEAAWAATHEDRTTSEQGLSRKAENRTTSELGLCALEGNRTATAENRTTSEQAFCVLEGGTIKPFSPKKEKPKKKGATMEEHMAGFCRLAESWQGSAPRRNMAEMGAYMALVAKGYGDGDIKAAADAFGAWAAGKEGGTHMALRTFLARELAKPQFLTSARRAARKAAAAKGAESQGEAATAAAPAQEARRKASPAKPGAAEKKAFTRDDLKFSWLGDGAWRVTTPGGLDEAFYPSWPLCREGAERSALAEAWCRSFGEHGAWSTFRALSADEVSLAWVNGAGGQGYWVATGPAGSAALTSLEHGRRANADPAALLGEINQNASVVRRLRRGGERRAA